MYATLKANASTDRLCISDQVLEFHSDRSTPQIVLNSNRNEIEDSTAFMKSLTHRFLSDLYRCTGRNADGDATKATAAHDDGLDALLGARQR